MRASRLFAPAGFGLLLGCSCVHASDFQVTRLDDSNPPQPGMLRAAVAAANAAPGADRIFIASGGTVSLTAGELTITGALEIQGLGPATSGIDPGAASRALSIVGDINHPDAVDVVLRGLSFTGGSSGNTGGGAVAVLDFARARVENCVFAGNRAQASGGALYVYQSRLTLLDSVLRENAAADVGGALAAEESQVRVERSVFVANDAAFGGAAGATGVTTRFDLIASRVENNTAAHSGGGLALSVPDVGITASTLSGNAAEYAGGGAYLLGVTDAGALLVQNSTLSGNTVRHEAGHGSGVALVHGRLQLRNSTVAYNRAPAADAAGDGIGIGGGVYVGEGGHTLELISTVVAGNTRGSALLPSELARGVDIDGPPSLLSARRSLIRVAPEAGVLNGVSVDNLVDVDPLLLPLAGNGGAVPTHALGVGSPACERGEDTTGLSYDERGAPFARRYGVVDVGAYEYRADTIFLGDFENHPEGSYGCSRR
ncbi:choice-of-anchor Q domain-containing protein [Tahibacter caeni]|uniref:choice-of-anchor Q domain-containing protein n=1 Tax=Tahibacter caeni TaxID=1453545 RepID=UPI0021497208|nr:choice-of-anchor Q domain-containing protein [Tahibacter caeni]